MSVLKTPPYITRLNTLREIEEVIEGKRMFSLPYRAGEKESLERRAHQIGGPRLREVLVKISAA